MKIVKTIDGVKKEIKKHQGHSIGFVPTMGYLHQGHLSLIEQSKKENDITVVSIFVNPTQFGPNEDFNRYPRDLQRDEALLNELDVDLLFFPHSTEMYPSGYSTYVEVETMGKVLCGKSRPTHFKGVATVVLKLFNIVNATIAYFGQKDAQQAILLKRMTTDLNLNTTVKVMPIVRDTDGLALSSRNEYLTIEEREAALHLPRALEKAKSQIRDGLNDASGIKGIIEKELKKSPLITIDYVEVVTLDTLENFPKNQEGQTVDIDMNNTLVAAAVRVGKTRLIDNFILGEI
jgi:pantoate--beta-alanine ligase